MNEVVCLSINQTAEGFHTVESDEVVMVSGEVGFLRSSG